MQGHLLELKLAAATALSYDEFWGTCHAHSRADAYARATWLTARPAMFGEGKIDSFEEILDTRLSPFLSSVYVVFPSSL